MKTFNTIAIAAALSALSFGAFAQTVTATGRTLDDAESVIAAQAQKEGASYKIIEANTNNNVHMTAELTK
ncbi:MULTISPECIES: DUF1471 domain-containing protein [Kosakonia]|uniref:YdgH/BhsA/McbA-like domain-containing protein n=2 Tax=Kosakonia TaxID=1330547 RepID=A0AAX2EL70_9ENTR|nr:MULTISPECIES: DUF1471 domain-containing protein [Kosakonia]MBS1205930.1 hypothetical protein [Pseudomonadota bacterium]MDP9565240.1 hypothetical protein [Kosakonia oryzae]SEL17822.1 Protein of unknown function [Kosakonia sacchari]ARD62282.1 DUF1471 domain-containing protein [Kosakonia radicincitans DSM 16656]KDE35934.1 hypothetical protein AW40_12460 [Kosakonia radicincitans UMEnt01/12]